MKLEALCTLTADVKPAHDLGSTPLGQRLIAEVTGGTFEGPRMKGTIHPGGGDWLRVGTDGAARLDVRITLETHDGALIYVQYPGVLDMNEAVMKTLGGGGEFQFGDTYYVIQPRFETSDERYLWLNKIMAIGEGRLLPGQVQYSVHTAIPG